MAERPSLVKNIVILGGSYAGTSTAHYLLKHVIPKLPDSSSYQVVLISASSEIFCRPTAPRALVSDAMFPQEKLFVSINGAFGQYPETSFRFVHGSATKVNLETRTAVVSRAQADGEEIISFHALVVATGASTPSPLHSLNTSSEALRSYWGTFREALPRADTIVIAGGGPAGVETAGELGEFLNGRHTRGLFGFGSQSGSPKVSITLITSAPRILPVLRASIAEQAVTYLAEVGVTVLTNTKVAGVSPGDAGTTNVASQGVLMLEDGQKLHASLYIPATGTRPNTDFLDASLLGADGRVLTNPSTLRVDAAGPRIYAIGDAGSYSRPAVHLILSAVPVLAANIKRDLLLAAGMPHAEVGEDKEFVEDTSESQLVPIGRSKGVGAMMGYRLPSFLVWLIKGRDYWLWTTARLWSGRQWAKES